MNSSLNIQEFKIVDVTALNDLEDKFRNKKRETQLFPWAENVSFEELATIIMPDNSKASLDEHPLYLSVSEHRTDIGINNLLNMTEEYIRTMQDKEQFQLLSLSADIKDDKIVLITFVRSYGPLFNLSGLFSETEESVVKETVEKTVLHGELQIPEELKNFSYTESQLASHRQAVSNQREARKRATKELPFLNQLDEYVPEILPNPIDVAELIYKVDKQDEKKRLSGSVQDFNKAFSEIMKYYSNGTEYNTYISTIREEYSREQFDKEVEKLVFDNFVSPGLLVKEDMPEMLKKLNRNLFHLGPIQDLIDDPIITDIQITGPYAIRVRVKGLTYLSDTTFVDLSDYFRFIDMIANRCNISMNIPEQTFTYAADDDYILRMTLTSSYVTSERWPYLHIRKISRKKMLSEDLLNAGMFDEKVMNYLLDCGRHSRGVVIAGRPGSGKTIFLNWFLEEAYEQSAAILCIQENDELFAYRKGVMFEHVVNYTTGYEEPIDLEGLGRLALVAGANVFIIGEAKGPEICSAITLSNSGCRTAITIHSNSSTDTIDKMADLAMRGYAKDMSQAKKMLTSFQTIIYLEDFKVKEISEVTGYDMQTDEVQYNYIYRNPYFDKQ